MIEGTDPIWNGRSVLITGHTGFKGAWLAWWLRSLGAEVIGYALPPALARQNLFTMLDLQSVIDSRYGDVRDARTLASVIESSRPEVIFHLAAQALVRPSYTDPRGTFDTNVVGTAILLDAVRMAPHVRAVVVVTSDKCYLNRGLTRGYREDDPLGGADPYSASKAAQEIVSASYRQSFFSDGPLLATVRAGNVIGGGDWSPERLVPDIIAALVSGSPVVLRYPDAVRPWQHVLEPLHAYLKIGANLLNGEAMVADAWNIGPAASDQRTVREIVERFAQIWDATSAWVRADDVQPHEAMALRLDAAKASSKLGIVPRLNLDAACEMTAHWYRSVTSGGNARSLCDADIARFMAH